MAAFIPSLPLPAPTPTHTPFKSPAKRPRIPALHNPTHTPANHLAQTYRWTPCATLDTDQTRDKALKSGVEALVEDFVKSGLNICIGAGPPNALAILLDAIAAFYQVDGLIDVAFISSSETTNAMLTERDLPSDLLVNFKSGIDLFIAPVSSMDAACNCILTTENFAADKFAARIARQVVLVIHEQDLEKGQPGLMSIPVQVVPFMADLAVESLCSGPLYDLGVRGATLRTDGSCIVDLALAPGISLHAIDDALNRLPQVVSTGLLLVTDRTTTVVATRDLQPIDITAPIHSIQNIPPDAKTNVLTGEKRDKMLATYAKHWLEITHDSATALVREFLFSSCNRAEAFVRYVQRVSALTQYFPQMKHCNASVEITLRSDRCSGITELDVLVSKELSMAYGHLEPGQE